MTEGAASHRRAILNYLRTCGQHGAIYTEIDQALGWPAATANRRLHELRKGGLVIRTATKRATPSGRMAHVYRICDVETQTVTG